MATAAGDQRVELEREIEYCLRAQNQLAARLADRSFTPDESQDWDRLVDRLAEARRRLNLDPTRRL